MADANNHGQEEPDSSGDGADNPLSDTSLLDLLDALVDDRDRVAAAAALEVNYRTLAVWHDSRSWSAGSSGWRMMNGAGASLMLQKLKEKRERSGGPRDVTTGFPMPAWSRWRSRVLREMYLGAASHVQPWR